MVGWYSVRLSFGDYAVWLVTLKIGLLGFGWLGMGSRIWLAVAFGVVMVWLTKVCFGGVIVFAGLCCCFLLVLFVVDDLAFAWWTGELIGLMLVI